MAALLYVHAYIKSTRFFHRFSPFTPPSLGKLLTPCLKLFPPNQGANKAGGWGGGGGERCSAPAAVTEEGLARMRSVSSPAPAPQVAQRAVVELDGQCRIHRRPRGSGRAAPTRAVWRAGRAGTLTISASTRPPSPASSWRRSWAAPSSAPPVARPARGRPPSPSRLGRPGAPSAADPSARPPCWGAEGGSSAGGVGTGSGGPGASLARQPRPSQVVGCGAGQPRLRPAARTVPASEAGKPAPPLIRLGPLRPRPLPPRLAVARGVGCLGNGRPFFLTPFLPFPLPENKQMTQCCLS